MNSYTQSRDPSRLAISGKHIQLILSDVCCNMSFIRASIIDPPLSPFLMCFVYCISFLIVGKAELIRQVNGPHTKLFIKLVLMN